MPTFSAPPSWRTMTSPLWRHRRCVTSLWVLDDDYSTMTDVVGSLSDGVAVARSQTSSRRHAVIRRPSAGRRSPPPLPPLTPTAAVRFSFHQMSPPTAVTWWLKNFRRRYRRRFWVGAWRFLRRRRRRRRCSKIDRVTSSPMRQSTTHSLPAGARQLVPSWSRCGGLGDICSTTSTVLFSCRETLTDCTIQSCVNTVIEKLTYVTDMCNVYNLFVYSYFIVLIVKEQILFFFVNLYECDGACVW